MISETLNILGLQIEVIHTESITVELKDGREILDLGDTDTRVLLLDGRTIAVVFAKVEGDVIARFGRDVTAYVEEVTVLSDGKIPIEDRQLNTVKINETGSGAYIVNFTSN